MKEYEVSEAEMKLMLGSPQKSLEQFLYDEDNNKMLYRALETLTPGEQKVLSFRFGLDGEYATLEEAAKKFDVTRERIRQIEAKAFRKLRHKSCSQELADHYREDM